MTKMKAIVYLFLCIVSIGAIQSCNTEEEKKKEALVNKPFDGPMMKIDTVTTYYSEQAEIRIKLEAPQQWEYQNGDRKFPKGVYIQFYEKGKSVKASYLKSNWAFYSKAKNTYTVRDNVIAENKLEKKKLKTEELLWNPVTGKVSTDKFVQMQTGTEVLLGDGLDADQDFKKFKVRHPHGIFSVAEE
jgi:LPS export ABC transporter protein LptC